ncbi:ethanolamine ammonia-lyase large subunit [Enterococcus sp. PF1-24]|uniref:ethanolamine ammonia-lyase subunit EutB n=1 Tax=unclassified Enterococcus TaxID=2608891 RepID=UPI002475D104|nr:MULTISPECIES: ethanolamine ammonia-lyase subunit EutB [unclassified Enterococcus]MDH6364919.1 ethanolamine ammonia-lyase large subunit [Enterococcus sp. PFB1-1]MDH6402020.1 ethanolamine ammonia-lyase large subunit [Enterococcus sp. PF1-24]
MRLKTTVSGTSYQFTSVRDVLAKANEEKSGDVLLRIGARTAQERAAAKVVLSELTLEDIRKNPVIDPEIDEVARIEEETINETIYNEIKNWTVGYLREKILAHETNSRELLRIGKGLNGAMAAAVAKIMSTMDLIYAGKKIIAIATCNTTIGYPDSLAFRLQGNHPTDSTDGILLSVMEGVSYGSGDACIGINPVDDTVSNITKIMESIHEFTIEWELPTQTVVLAHISTQMECVSQGAKTSMLFQSLAGTEDANKAFGIDDKMLMEGYDLIHKYGVASGENLMYFETGQGSELSIGAAHNIDQLTLEAKKYVLARKYKPFMLNTVSGFIGPETIFDGKQMMRAAIEDHFMGKLLGIPMGTAPVYTNHTKMDQNDHEMATMLLSLGGSNFFMGVPCGDDVMLSYQDTSYHDDATLRELTGRKPIKEYHEWLMKHEIMDEHGILTPKAGDATLFYKK